MTTERDPDAGGSCPAPAVTRRRLCAAGAGTLASTLAGCSGLAPDRWGEAERTRIRELAVFNLVPRPVTLSVLVLESGEPAYWRTRTADAAAEDGNRAGGAGFDELPSDPGRYVVYVRLPDRPRAEWERLDLREYDVECTGLVLRVEEHEDSGVDLRMLASAGCPEEEA